MNGIDASMPAGGRSAGDSSQALSSILGELVKTRGFAMMMGNLLPGIVDQWAGRNPFKKLITKIVGRSLRKGFTGRADTGSLPDLAGLVRDPAFLENLGRQLPFLADGLTDIAAALAGGIAGLPAAERVRFLDALFAGPHNGNAGRVLTSFARIINETHRDDPGYFSEKMRPAVAAFVAAADFGELKELLDDSSQDLVAFTKMLNEELWKYPAKMICLLSMVPSLFNTAVKSLNETMAPINGLAPDLLADVVLSLIEEVDGGAIGSVINQASELVRKIHTGSTLIGEQGKPQFPVAVNHAVAGMLATLDVNLLLKARSLLGEIRELTLESFIDLLGHSPVLAREYFQSVFRTAVAVIRSWSRKVEAFEMLFTDEEIAREFAQGMGEIDAQQLGETVSRLSALLNGVRKNTPGVIRTVLTQVLGSLDSQEIGETMRWLTNDVVRSIKPLAPEILPQVIRGVAELLNTDQYDDPGEMEDALATLRKALVGKEVAL